MPCFGTKGSYGGILNCRCTATHTIHRYQQSAVFPLEQDLYHGALLNELGRLQCCVTLARNAEMCTHELCAKLLV